MGQGMAPSLNLLTTKVIDAIAEIVKRVDRHAGFVNDPKVKQQTQAKTHLKDESGTEALERHDLLITELRLTTLRDQALLNNVANDVQDLTLRVDCLLAKFTEAGEVLETLKAKLR